MTNRSLETVFQHHRELRYDGPTPQWPQPARWRPSLWAAMATAAALALLASPWLRSNTDFGLNYSPRPSAYSALKRVRQSAPELTATQRTQFSSPRLPAIPQRRSGFAPSGPTPQDDASTALKRFPTVG